MVSFVVRARIFPKGDISDDVQPENCLSHKNGFFEVTVGTLAL